MIVSKAKPQRKRSVANGGLTKGVNGDLGTYTHTVRYPFYDSAIGGRVPDMFSAPTATYHTKGTSTIFANASGIASFVFSPNPLLSMVDMTTNSVFQTGMTAYPNSTNVYAATSLVNLQNAYQSYRVVGAGIRIRNLMPPTTATGRLLIAPFVVSGGGPGPAALSTVAFQNAQVSDFIGVPITSASTTAGVPSNILELPGSEEYTMQDLITNGVDCWCKPVTPGSFEFHNTYNVTGVTGSTASMGQSVMWTTATGVVAGSGTDAADVSAFHGFTGFAVRLEGLPFSTTVAEVEYIYHFEGVPALSASTAGGLVPTVPPVSHVDINGFNSVVSKIVTQPTVNYIQDFVSDAVGKAAKGGSQMLMRTMMARMGLSL